MMAAPPIRPPARPERSLRALAALREKIRSAFLLDGIVAAVLMVLALALVGFLLDYALVLPRAVRAVLLIGSAVYLVWFVVRRVVAPGRVPMSEEDLAALVEARSPELSQALVTAVELSRPGHRGAAHVSPELIAAVVRQVEEKEDVVRPGRVIDLRPVRQNGALLGLLLAAIAGGAIWRPDLVRIWLGRYLLLSDRSWPKSTMLEMVSPKERPAFVALGDDLQVEVRALRGEPARVEIQSETEGTSWSDVMVQGADGAFRKVFENVSRPFRFRVRGGDDELPEVRVEVRLQPSLARLDVWYSYPPYTGLDPTPPEKPLANPSVITVPAGTRAAMRAWCDLPLGEAWFVFRPREEGADAGPGDAAGTPSSSAAAAPERWPEPDAVRVEVQAAAAAPAPLVPESPPAAVPEGAKSMFSVEFPVEKDGTFWFQLRSADGFPGRKGKTVAVRAIPDRPPLVKIVEPGRASEEVTVDATVRMEFLVRHAYGIRNVALRGRPVAPGGDAAGEPGKEELEFPLGEAAPGPREAKSEVRTTYVLDLSKVPGLAPGGKLEYYAQAFDFAEPPHEGRSEGYVLHILTREDMKRILNDRLMLLRDGLQEIARDQESARKDLLAYRDELLKGKAGEKGAIAASGASRLVRSRQDQERIASRLARIGKELEGNLTAMDANRVGDEKEKAWIGALREEVEVFAGKRSPAISGAIEDLRSAALGAPQPPDRIDPIAEEERRLEKDILLLANRLREFGDVNWVIQQFQDMKRRQEEIRDRTKARAVGPSGEGSAPSSKKPDGTGEGSE